MAYLSLHFGDKEVVVTPDLIRDFGRQLQNQIEDISPTELMEMLDAAGLLPDHLRQLLKGRSQRND